MGNFSRDPQAVFQDAVQKGYSRVRFQQGKPLLDRDLNLLGDLASPQRLAARYVGNGVPVNEDGFRIDNLDVAANDFTIQAGRCLVGGYDIVLDQDTTYKSQPRTDNVAPLPAGTSQVYLRVFLTEADGDRDEELRNSGHVGFETAVREKVEWEVLVSPAEIFDAEHFPLAEIKVGAHQQTVTDRRRTGLTLAAINDEVRAARGGGDHLAERLSRSMTPTGLIKANSVDTAQIAHGAVSLTQLKQKLVFDGGFTLSRGQERSFKFVRPTEKRHAHVFISAFVDTVSSDDDTVIAGISWRHFFQHRVRQDRSHFLRGVTIQNHASVTVTVRVRAHELLER